MLNEDELINHPSPSYTPGRQGTRVRHITFHHVVGSAESALARFDNPNEQVSAHFVVADDSIYVCVNTDDTAWTNGVWASNLESITIEHEGDWRNGYRNDAVIANSARLVAWLRSLYPDATPKRHRDIIATACPGDLPVEEIWDKASAILNPPPQPDPAPEVPPTLEFNAITPKKVVTTSDTNLWDLSFTNWHDAQSVKVLPKDTTIDVAATVNHPLGGVYYISQWSYDRKIFNGINVVDVQDYSPPQPEPTPPVPTEPEPPVEPPVVVPPVEGPVIPVVPSKKKALWEAIKSLLRLVVFAIPGILIAAITNDPELGAGYGVPILAVLKLIDKYIHESDKTKLRGLVPF